MIKNLISRLSVLIVLTVFMAACSGKAEYTNAIPADATAIASINLKALIEKSGIGDKENEALKQKMLEAFKSEMNAATFQQLEKVLSDPLELGIDVLAPVYLFTSTSFPYPTVVAKVDNEDQLRACLNILIKEQLCQPITKEDGFSLAAIGADNFLAYNATTALIVTTNGVPVTENVKKSVTTLLAQTTESSISNKPGFKRMQEQKGDISFFASMASIPDMYAKQISAGLPAEIDPKEMMVLGGMNFEKGRIALKVENYTENKEMAALLKKQEKALTKINTNFLKYFPESTLSFLSVGANGAELYNLLLNNKEFCDNVSIAQAAEVKSLFDSFNGDISLGLLNVAMMGNNPTLLAYADVKNGDALKAIYANKQVLGLKSGEEIAQLSENEYVYKSKKMNIFFGVRGKQLYATNDELLYKNIGKPVERSIEDSAYASEMEGKNLFWVINVQSILEMPIVKMMVGLGGEEYQTYGNLASEVLFLEMSNEAGGKNEVTLVLKNQDTNALKQLVDFAKQFANM